MPTTPTPQLRLISFGFGHPLPPPAGLFVIDVRDWFRDPHITPGLRALCARDQLVVDTVLATPGVRESITALIEVVGVFVGLGTATVTAAVGCVGGRHRSAVIVNELASRARGCGWTVDVEHRDIDKPVLTGTRR